MAIAFDNSASGTGAGVTGHLTHTSSGSNRILFAFIVGASAGGLVTSVTCGGVPMTKILGGGGVSGFSMEAYYLLSAPTGTQDIQFNWSSDSGFYFSMLSQSYTGANAYDGLAVHSGSSFSTVAVTVTTALANSWIITPVFANGGGGFTDPSGYTNRVTEFSNLSGIYSASDDSNGTVTVGSHTITWNWSTSTGGQAMAIGIAAGTQPSTDSGLFMISD